MPNSKVKIYDRRLPCATDVIAPRLILPFETKDGWLEVEWRKKELIVMTLRGADSICYWVPIVRRKSRAKT